MPGDEGRKWLIFIGKLLAPPSSEPKTDIIAEKLGIKKPSLLNGCVRDSASNTTRQIVKLLYPPEKLDMKKRSKVVTQEQRKLIKGKIFLESLFRPISDYAPLILFSFY